MSLYLLIKLNTINNKISFPVQKQIKLEHTVHIQTSKCTIPLDGQKDLKVWSENWFEEGALVGLRGRDAHETWSLACSLGSTSRVG